MPIFKNIPFGKCEDATILLFGGGDISVATSNDIDSKSVCIVFMQMEDSRPIGEPDDSKIGSKKDDISMDVLMRFTKTESIDVVVEALGRLKLLLTEKLKS